MPQSAKNEAPMTTAQWCGFEALTTQECERLLGTIRLGRLAISAGALPAVVPVRFSVRPRQLLIRTPGHGELADHQIDGQIVAFEADDLDLDRGVGWCVSVTGQVHTTPSDPQRPPYGWFSDGTSLLLDADVITGHRVVA